MEQAAQTIENELQCYRLLSVDDSQKVGALTAKVKNIHVQLSDEVTQATAIDDYITTIKETIRKINREQTRQSSVLDLSEKSMQSRQNDVTQALQDCEVNTSSH